jgi:Skp family chaperone for outer membrane proteins
MDSPNITIDGVTYAVSQFSQPVQQAIGIYNAFQGDLTKAQLEVLKVQAALQHCGTQINEAAKRELAALAAVNDAEVKPVEESSEAEAA